MILRCHLRARVRWIIIHAMGGFELAVTGYFITTENKLTAVTDRFALSFHSFLTAILLFVFSCQIAVQWILMSQTIGRIWPSFPLFPIAIPTNAWGGNLLTHYAIRRHCGSLRMMSMIGRVFDWPAHWFGLTSLSLLFLFFFVIFFLSFFSLLVLISLRVTTLGFIRYAHYA